MRGATSLSCVVTLTALALTLGCDSRGSPAAPAVSSSVSRGALPERVSTVFTTDDRAALSASVLDPSREPAVRLAALRRLEELGAPETVHLASELARATEPLLWQNAVGVLVRANAPEADGAVAGLRPEARQLARALQLQGQEGGAR